MPKDDELDEYTVTGVFADHGSLVQLLGRDEDGHSVLITAEHRPAQAIVEALEEHGEVYPVHAPPWAVRRFP